MTRDQLFDTLSALTPTQLHTIVYKLAVPRAILPGPPAPSATLIIEVLLWAEQQGRLKDVIRVLAEVSAPAPATFALDSDPAPALRQGAADGGIAQTRTSTVSDAAGAASAGRPMVRNSAQPTPDFLNAEVQALGEQLERARQRNRACSTPASRLTRWIGRSSSCAGSCAPGDSFAPGTHWATIATC